MGVCAVYDGVVILYIMVVVLGCVVVLCMVLWWYGEVVVW